MHQAPSGPLFDVVIPNRNKARFIRRTLDSLCAQTEARWRAIIIDNESDDGSWEIIGEFARKDPRFLISQQPPPAREGRTFYRTWNEGLRRATAPHVAVLTSDDLWPANWLECARRNLEAHPAAIAAVGRATLIDDQDRLTGVAVAATQLEASFAAPLRGPQVLNGVECALRALLIGPIFTTIHAVVFRRAALETGLAFAEDLGFAADHEFYLHLCLAGDIVYDPSVAAAFRVYADQASSAAQNEKVIAYFRTTVERNRDEVARRGRWPRDEVVARTEELLARHRFILTKPSWATLKSAPWRAARQALQAAGTMPGTAVRYLGAGLNREKFLGGYALNCVDALRADP